MGDTLHVLTIAPFYPSERDDASGCFIAEPLRALEKFDVESSAIVVRPFYAGKVKPNPSAPAEWLRYFSFPSGVGLSSAGAFLFARLLSKVRKLHSAKPIDIIHAHGPLPAGHAATLLSREMGIPFVITVHGLDAYSTKQVSGFAGRWCERMCSHIYSSAKNVICVSEHVREKVLEKVHCQTVVVYNGVDSELFSPAPGNEIKPIVLSIGNLIPTKGHALLLHAIAIGNSHYPEISCEIIGEGPERAALERLAKGLNIAHKVHFRGRVNRKEVAAAMRRCAVFALPSRYEALGCVYLEAMSSAVPVIGCRGQGIEEIIEHGRNGWLTSTENPDELALAITTLLENGEQQKTMRLAARRTILKSLTLAHQAKRLRDVYEAALA